MNETQAIERMRQVIRRQHKALATEDAYVLWLRRYMKALHHMPPGLSSEKKMETFLTDLAVEHDVSASTQNQAFNALLTARPSLCPPRGPMVHKQEAGAIALAGHPVAPLSKPGPPGLVAPGTRPQGIWRPLSNGRTTAHDELNCHFGSIHRE
jgi:hypothetical protein